MPKHSKTFRESVLKTGVSPTGGNYTVNALPVIQTQTPPVQQPKVTKTTTTKTEQTTTPNTTVTAPETSANQTAGLAQAKGAGTFFGWIWSNIIWIIHINS